jgi:hypothetical protein
MHLRAGKPGRRDQSGHIHDVASVLHASLMERRSPAPFHGRTPAVRRSPASLRPQARPPSGLLGGRVGFAVTRCPLYVAAIAC